MSQHLPISRATPHSGAMRHQTRLVYIILMLMTLYLAAIGTLNVLLFEAYTIATLNYAGMLGISAVLWYFHRSGQLLLASWLVVLLSIGVILVFIHMADGRAYSLIWITLLPPVTFFLLGRRAGAWICGLAFLYVIALVYLRLPHWEPAEFTLGTWLNIVEVLIAHWLLFRLYERSRAEAFAELERLSETDKLTGLYNRSRLDTFLQHEIERQQRNQSPLTLVLCDIDHFKRINDRLGHLGGDAALRTVARLLAEQMRASDICGRWGGEEFLIICPDTPAPAATHIVSKLQEAVAGVKLEKNSKVTLSFGVATMRAGEDADQLLRRADDALYEAKHRGRDRFVVAPDEPLQPASAH